MACRKKKNAFLNAIVVNCFLSLLVSLRHASCVKISRAVFVAVGILSLGHLVR